MKSVKGEEMCYVCVPTLFKLIQAARTKVFYQQESPDSKI